MNFNANKHNTYKSNIVFLAFMTSLSALGCILVGYFAFPFAVAYYAALLWYEKPEKRALSYIIPSIVFVLNFVFNGIYSLEGIAYVAVGLIIFFCFKKGVSKGETVFYAVLATVLLLTFSAFLFAFDYTGAANYSSVELFYSKIYMECRNDFLSRVTSIVTADKLGIRYFAMNSIEADLLFRDMVYLVIPVTVILSFFLVGLSCKLFTSNLAKYSEDETIVSSWNFRVSSLLSYFYILVCLTILFVRNSDSVFAISVSHLHLILLTVFAYVGFVCIYYLIAPFKGTAFTVLILVFACILLSSFAFDLLSYVGAYFSIATARYSKKKPKN